MRENDFCFECGKVFEDGEAVSGSPVDGYCCKGGCVPIKHPICPINCYFEGDEDKCDVSKCDWNMEMRSCTEACRIRGDENMDNVEQKTNEIKLIPVSHKNYMELADAYDKHSRTLMTAKGEEYSISGDFLAMENRLAGMLGDSPEYVSLVMAGKHITALGIILNKNNVTKINLEKLDERIRDATNLLKITSAFIHAKQNDFSLHLGKGE